MDEAIDGLTEIGQWSLDLNTTTNNVAGYIIAAMLSLSLVFVVWAVSMKKDNAKTYVIAWFVALVFAIVFVLK